MDGFVQPFTRSYLTQKKHTTIFLKNICLSLKPLWYKNPSNWYKRPCLPMCNKTIANLQYNLDGLKSFSCKTFCPMVLIYIRNNFACNHLGCINFFSPIGLSLKIPDINHYSINLPMDVIVLIPFFQQPPLPSPLAIILRDLKR